MRSLLGRRLLPAAGLLSIALVLGTVPAPAGAESDDPTTAASTTTSTDGDPEPTATDLAEAALAQVQDQLTPEQAATEAPQTTREEAAADAVAAPDLTLAMRELRTRMADLSARDRAVARKIVSRPSSDLFRDFGGVRVHWSSSDAAVTNAWVNQVGAVVTHVLSTYQGAGYRAPESDGDLGGASGKLDIYLVDFASQGQSGLYGYCDSDKPIPARGPYDAWAFCAFDHSFTGFPTHTPLENLQVTAAHELFHATQFAYDYREDAWFMEATAVWAEDEVYDAVNDNLQYNDVSPLRQPRQSLDQFGDSLRQYGEWFFFRYLAEHFPAQQGGMATIIRRIWERADASSGAPDNYSIQAVSKELASRHSDLRRTFAQFADANRRPRSSYAEGAHYPTAPAKKRTVTAKHRSTGWQQVRLNHLSSATFSVKPPKGMRHWRLRVNVDLPAKRFGSAAVLTSYDAKGRAHRRMVTLSKKGDGSATVRFDARKVRRVDLTLANGSTRYRCWVGAVKGVQYSCSGHPRDDRRPMRYRIRALPR